MQVIIFQGVDGVAVSTPAAEVVAKYGMQWVANKTVPGSGTPYWVVNAADLPTASQEAWVLDPSVPPTGVTP